MNAERFYVSPCTLMGVKRFIHKFAIIVSSFSIQRRKSLYKIMRERHGIGLRVFIAQHPRLNIQYFSSGYVWGQIMHHHWGL